MAPATLDGSLSILSATGMIRRLDDSELAYMIKHAMVQDTAQSTLLKNESKFLHLMVALALEQVNAGRLDEYAAELAHHFSLAEDDVKTFEYSLRAGDVAARVFANAEALAHYHRAIEIGCRGLATSEQIIHLYTRRGRILEVTGEYNAALASYHELRTLAEQRGDRSLELAYLMLRAPLHSAPLPTFDAALAKQLLLDALGTARELGDERAEARILWNLTLLSTHTSQPTDGVMYGELSLALTRKLDLPEQQAYTLHELFIPYHFTGQRERANQVLAQAREMFRAMDNKSMLADNLGMSGQFAVMEGDLERGLEFATEGAAVSRSIGNRFGVAFNSIFVVRVLFEWGENELVIDKILEQFEFIDPNLSSVNPVMIASVHAWVLAWVGATELSNKLERSVRETAWPPTPPLFRAGTFASLARTRLLYNDVNTAAADIARGLADLGSENAGHPAAVQFPLAQAELAIAQGDYPLAIKQLTEQADWCREFELGLVLPENFLLQAYAHLAMRDARTALAILEQALALAQKIGTRRLEWQILAALAQAARRNGNSIQAEEYMTQARAVLEYIVQHTPENYRAGFTRLTSVQQVLFKD